MLMAAVGNTIVGSDATEISSGLMFYSLIRSPERLKRLVEEVEDMDRAGNVGQSVTFTESSDMPYI